MRPRRSRFVSHFVNGGDNVERNPGLHVKVTTLDPWRLCRDAADSALPTVAALPKVAKPSDFVIIDE